MYQLTIDTPTGPERLSFDGDAGQAYEVMLATITYLAVDAASEFPEWQEDLNNLCDDASIATNDTEAGFVRAAWNDWARDYLTHGQTRLEPRSALRKSAAGRTTGKRALLGTYQVIVEAPEDQVPSPLNPVLRRLTTDPYNANTESRYGVGRFVWRVAQEGYAAYYVVDEETETIFVIEAGPIIRAELPTATLGQPKTVTYAGS